MVVISGGSREPSLALVAGEGLAAISRVTGLVPIPALETLPTLAAKVMNDEINPVMEDQNRRNPHVAGEK